MSSKREKILSEEGKPLLVLRPKDPHRATEAVSEARALVGEKGPEAAQAFQDILRGEYVFLGWLARDKRTGRPCVVDDEGRYAGELETGDSFATHEEREEREELEEKPS